MIKTYYFFFLKLIVLSLFFTPLNALKNEIIVLKEEKQYIENLSNNQIYSINESYKNLEIYKNIKLSSNTIKLVRNIKNNF